MEFSISYTDRRCVNLALIGLILRGPVVDLLTIYKLGLLENLINVVFIAFFVFGLVAVFRHIPKFIIFSTLVFGVLWIITMMRFPQNITYIREEIVQSFIYSFPFIWIGYFCVKKRIYLNLFLPILRVKLILALLVQCIILFNPESDIFKGDYQTAANSILVGLIVVYYLSAKYKKKSDIILAVLGTTILYVCGSRSSFVAVIFFWFFFLLSVSESKKTKYVLISLTALVLLFEVNTTLNLLSSLAQSLGYSTHLSEAVQSGEVFMDENRVMLYLGFLDKVGQSPWGYGLMGDRWISEQYGLFWKAIYPHNIYIEILVHFGYILGIAIALVFTYKLFKSMLLGKNSQYKAAVLIIASVSFVKLLFSSSYLIDQMFFLLLGLLLGASYAKKDVIGMVPPH